MALDNKIPLPDDFIEENNEYQRILNKPNRTTTGQFEYQNPRTLASYTTLGTTYDNQGEAGMALLLYNQTPKLIDYIFDDATYAELKNLVENADAWVRPVTDNEIKIAELYANESIQSIVGKNGETYYDYVGSQKAFTSGTIDQAKVYSETVNQGTNTLVVSSLLRKKDGTIPSNLADCFIVGEEITLQDDTSKEFLIISNIDDGTDTLTFTTNIQNTYALGANAYRSNVKEDDDKFVFDGFETEEETAVDVTVNGSNYITSNNARPIKLDNGWWVMMVRNGTTQIIWFVSKDNRQTWQQLCFANGTVNAFAMCSDGTNIFAQRIINASATAQYYEFDATTVSDVAQASLTLTSGKTSFGSYGDIFISDDKTKICATWVSRDATRPLTFNVWEIQGTISSGSISWGTETQRSLVNVSGDDYTDVSGIYKDDGFPLIAYVRNTPSLNVTACYFYNGASWGSGTIKQDNGFVRARTTLDKKSDGAIVVGWDARDTTEPSTNNMWFKESTNGGSSWINEAKVTTGASTSASYGSIIVNSDDDVFIVFVGVDSGVSAVYSQLQMVNNVGGSWSARQTLTNITTVSSAEIPSVSYAERTFTIPNIGYNAEDTVKFLAQAIQLVTTDITDIDIRINVETFEDRKKVVAIMETNDVDTLTLDGFLSVRTLGSNESYINLTDVKTDEGTSNTYMSTGEYSTPEKEATVKYELTRPTTGTLVEINRVQGGMIA